MIKNLLTFIGLLSFLLSQHVSATNAEQGSFIVASFNVSMEARNYVTTDDEASRLGSRVLMQQLASGQHPQIKNIAEIIQRNRPDIILLNEFDYINNPASGIQAFISNYLAKAQNGAEPIHYPYYFYAPSNTGLPTSFDLNNDGVYGQFGSDAQGFGLYHGHYAMVLLSRYPIIKEEVRTFQRFLWSDMPGALAPISPDTKLHFYNDEEWRNLRLSSKSHWDVPVNVNGKIVHLLASHPTPPVFDGDEDRNGKRNNDEIRFWLDYITPGQGNYIYDDRGISGGLTKDVPFVIVGDLNASPDRVEAGHAILTLLSSNLVNNDFIPSSDAGQANRPDNNYAKYHTASWAARADYVTPSTNIRVLDGGVFWPSMDEPLHRLVKDRASSSDHYLVWLELTL